MSAIKVRFSSKGKALEHHQRKLKALMPRRTFEVWTMQLSHTITSIRSALLSFEVVYLDQHTPAGLIADLMSVAIKSVLNHGECPWAHRVILERSFQIPRALSEHFELPGVRDDHGLLDDDLWR